MRWKMYAVLAALLLMVTTVPPLKVQAQSIVLIALYAVVGVGPEETVEIHWASRPSQAAPLRPAIEPGSQTIFSIVVTNNGPSSNAAACTQAFSVPVVANAGLNTLNVAIGSGGELVINGQVAGVLDPCFAVGGKRNTIAVGRQIPSDVVDRFAADPTRIPVESNHLHLHEIWGYSIVDSNGRTLASVSPSNAGGSTPYTLRVMGVLN